jgi:mRNA-degrading endonuclease toxin of MazEF toxin-antitoxin module
MNDLKKMLPVEGSTWMPSAATPPLRIVVPVTDWKSDFENLSWFVFLLAASENGLSKDSGADAFQVKSVSETRFVRKLGEVTDAQIDEIAAIALYVGVPGKLRIVSPESPPRQAADSGIKGDVLNCCGGIPGLRRAVLPGSFNLPKQLRMSPLPSVTLLGCWRIQRRTRTMTGSV